MDMRFFVFLSNFHIHTDNNTNGPSPGGIGGNAPVAGGEKRKEKQKFTVAA